MWKTLFIAGCPRSGTSALRNVIAEDKRIAIGMERYYFRAAESFSLVPEHFEAERFYSLREGDTFSQDLEAYETLKDYYEQTVLRGDKIPKLYRHFENLFSVFADCRVLFIYRNVFDVAASYNSRANNVNDLNWARNQDYTVALADWNESLRCCLEALKSGHNIMPVCYETFFDSVDELCRIYDFLGIDMLEDHLRMFEKYVEEAKIVNDRRKDSLSGKQKADILMLADIGSYRRLRELT